MYGELKGIAKDAVAYGNRDDKKTVEYIIKWIHNHTEYDKRVMKVETLMDILWNGIEIGLRIIEK